MIAIGRCTQVIANITDCGSQPFVVNIGNKPLKLYSIYAPPQYPFGTVLDKISRFKFLI